MVIDWKTYEAVLFDLDGVLTATAALHARAWKRMFDDFLTVRATRSGELPTPFELPRDYALHVDGLPRYDGVRGFLAARRIDLPAGSPDDPPDRETVCGLGNRKQRLFSDLLASEGVDAYPGSWPSSGTCWPTGCAGESCRRAGPVRRYSPRPA